MRVVDLAASAMLNPLLHTSSSSCPTSPMLTRSIHVQPAAAGQSKAVVGANAIVAAVVARRPGGGGGGASRHGSLMQRLSRDSSPTSASVTSEATLLTSASSSTRRRLSRVVKCRTLDFTEFPEGMREYAFFAHAAGNNNNNSGGKMLVRESRSQPGSPVSIPKIQVQDFGNFAGSEVRHENESERRADKHMYGRNIFLWRSCEHNARPKGVASVAHFQGDVVICRKTTGVYLVCMLHPVYASVTANRFSSLILVSKFAVVGREAESACRIGSRKLPKHRCVALH